MSRRSVQTFRKL